MEDGAWARREDGSPKPKRIKRGRRSGGLGNGTRQPMDTGQGEDDEGPGRTGEEASSFEGVRRRFFVCRWHTDSTPQGIRDRPSPCHFSRVIRLWVR